MVFGVDDVLGVAALSLTFLHGCVKGLTVLSKARHYDRDVSNVRLQIELSVQSLFTWAEEAGLTQEPPTLLVSARYVALVVNILSQLERLLQDLDHLKGTYGLHLSLSAGNVDALNDEDSTLSKLGVRQREYMTRADIAIFRKRKEPWRRLRWVTLDDKKVARLLEKINGFIRELERFLEQSKQAKRDRYLELAYRDAVLNADGQQELLILGQEYEQRAAPTNAAVAAAARLKQTRLRLRLAGNSTSMVSVSSDRSQLSQIAPDSRSHASVPTSSDTSSVPLDSMRLSIRSLTLPRLAQAPGLARVLAFYDNSAVLLEWKSGPSLKDARILDNRVNQVAAFLHELEPSFHSLPCRGFVKDHEANRYGYIFDLPRDLSALNLQLENSSRLTSQHILPSMPEMLSLREFFDHSDQSPSLNDRLHLSLIVLETILNLHTSGWLHKELRSANMILIRPPSSAEARSILSSYTIYVAGYVYARADDPSELTEPLAYSTEADLYRHPSSLGKSREPFCKYFDLFSVGCTLLEIGLWTSLRQILAYHASSTNSFTAYGTKGSRQSSWTPPQGSSVPHFPSALPRKETSSAPERSSGDGHRNEGGKGGVLDYMQLRHELLLLPLRMEQKQLSVPNAMESSNTPRARCNILRSLEAAMGTSYTHIVEELLSAAERNEDRDEHEFALDLEVRAKDVVQAIANAV